MVCPAQGDRVNASSLATIEQHHLSNISHQKYFALNVKIVPHKIIHVQYMIWVKQSGISFPSSDK